MRIRPIKTEKIFSSKQGLFSILDRYLKRLPNRSVLAITSKIVALAEGRIVPIGSVEKDALIRKEADYYLPRNGGRHNIMLTVKNGILIPTAGIDESNANDFYVLWPKHPQRTANAVCAYLRRRFKAKQVGVILTDSKTVPLRRGTTGVAIAHSGFHALKNYVGKPDVFGKKMKMTKANVADALAAAAVLVMGEGDEQTPFAIIEDIPFVAFEKKVPSAKELRELRIPMREDLYAPLLKGVAWRKKRVG